MSAAEPDTRVEVARTFPAELTVLTRCHRELSGARADQIQVVARVKAIDAHSKTTARDLLDAPTTIAVKCIHTRRIRLNIAVTPALT